MRWPTVSHPRSRRAYHGHTRYDDLYQVTQIDYGYGDSQGPSVFRSPFLPEVNAGDTAPVPLQLQPPLRVSQQTFSYDFLGNVISSGDDATVSYDRSLGTIAHGGATDGPNQLHAANGVSASYDDAGNMVELKVTRQGSCPSGTGSKCAQWFAYEWDEVGQLSRATRWDYDTTLPLLGPGELPVEAPAWDLRYAYSEGSRVRKSAKEPTGVERHTLDVFGSLRLEQASFDEQTETYARDRWTEKVYLAGGAARVFAFTNSDLPVAPTPESVAPIHMYLTIGDHLGSALATIEHASGELVERATHQAYGAIESDHRPDRWNHAREPFKFTGKEEDIEVGLAYFGARYYQPHLGRWMSADPLTVHALGSDLNPYAYVGGNVLSTIDPLGLEGESSGGSGDSGDSGTYPPRVPGSQANHPNGTYETTFVGWSGPAYGGAGGGLILDTLPREGSGLLGAQSGMRQAPGSLLGIPPNSDEFFLRKEIVKDGKVDEDYQKVQEVGAVVAAVVVAAVVLSECSSCGAAAGAALTSLANLARAARLLRAARAAKAVQTGTAAGTGAGAVTVGKQASQGCATGGGGCAPTAIPTLTRGPGRDMLRQAVDHLRRAGGAERVGMFRNFVGQITGNATDNWSASEGVYTNGTIFIGPRGGFALAFDSAGNIYSGNVVQNPAILQPAGSGGWRIAFDLMTEIK